MIDIHTHVLPFVDDGSKNMDDTISLLKLEEESGVSDVVCTPHLRSNYRADKETLDGVFKDVKARASEEGIKVNLHLGRELYVSKHYKSNIKTFSATMPNPKFLLIEFSFSFDCEVVETVYELIGMGYTPIVAHPERYPYITIRDIEEIKSAGGLIQINAESVLSSPLSRPGRFAKKLLGLELVDFVASDMHFGRRYSLLKAQMKVSKKYGCEYADKIFNQNAKIIIEG